MQLQAHSRSARCQKANRVGTAVRSARFANLPARASTSEGTTSSRSNASSTDATQSTTPSSSYPAQPQQKSLSPKSFAPNVSGVSVGGYSPTSLQGWTVIKDTLRDANVKMVSAQEVVFAKERGVPIIDVRPEDQYEKGHIPGALNVPFFRPIQGWEPAKIARRVGYALFGVLNGTEANPDFAQQAAALVHSELGAILYCSIGGTLEPTENSKKGLQSRSLIAAWQLVSNGQTNISVMKGGYSEWVNNGRDVAMMVEDS